MNRIALQTVVDLNVVLAVVGILMLVVVGVLLAILLIRLNKTVSKVNQMLDRKQDDIEKTISNLPALTKNIGDVAGEATKTVENVNQITGKVTGVVTSFTAKKSSTGSAVINFVTKIIELIQTRMASGKKDE